MQRVIGLEVIDLGKLSDRDPIVACDAGKRVFRRDGVVAPCCAMLDRDAADLCQKSGGCAGWQMQLERFLKHGRWWGDHAQQGWVERH